MEQYQLFKNMECLRLQLQMRDLKRKYGTEQAHALIAEALRLEFASALDTDLPVPEKIGVKKVPVLLQ
jgi:hypothetical protein